MEKIKFDHHADTTTEAMGTTIDKVTKLYTTTMKSTDQVSKLIEDIWNNDDYDVPTKLLAIFGVGGKIADMKIKSDDLSKRIDKKMKKALAEIASEMGVDVQMLKVEMGNDKHAPDFKDKLGDIIKEMDQLNPKNKKRDF